MKTAFSLQMKTKDLKKLSNTIVLKLFKLFNDLQNAEFFDDWNVLTAFSQQLNRFKVYNSFIHKRDLLFRDIDLYGMFWIFKIFKKKEIILLIISGFYLSYLQHESFVRFKPHSIKWWRLKKLFAS